MLKSDLPFGSEFSPNQIDLPTVLNFIMECAGDKKRFEERIKVTFFQANNTDERNKRKLASNVRLALRAYQIINDDLQLTDVGLRLYQHKDNDEKLYGELARHILVNLHGLTLVQCVQDIQAAGERVDLVKLRLWLEERGIHFPRGGKHPS